MIAMIQVLMDKGIAYQSEDKSIYFSIEKFPEYGKLAHIDRDNQRAGVRIDADEYAKDSVADFALWKARDEADGDVWCESPWGQGRPGWHIECSAMSMKYLGENFDLHTGGVDNMFPHHEDEIAQSESVTGKKWVNYWLHCEHLMVDNTKMSKSLGNFYTLRDLLAKGYTGREVRWVLIGTHYRKKLNFSLTALDQARETLGKFTSFFARMKEITATGDGSEAAAVVEQAQNQFRTAIADDLNSAGATAALFTLVREGNRLADAGTLSAAGAAKLLECCRDFDRIFGCLDVDAAPAAEEFPAEVVAMAEERAAARKNKNWAESDRLRDAIKEAGFLVEDAPGGVWKLKKL
jgi:cysteinyl-tRNA synthetase